MNPGKHKNRLVDFSQWNISARPQAVELQPEDFASSLQEARKQSHLKGRRNEHKLCSFSAYCEAVLSFFTDSGRWGSDGVLLLRANFTFLPHISKAASLGRWQPYRAPLQTKLD